MPKNQKRRGKQRFENENTGQLALESKRSSKKEEYFIAISMFDSSNVRTRHTLTR